ncbi:substrate-binding domain-containing protein [Quadrisphaera sp. DSM 44207]|uniref:substrate-binding domain-containing protein n=1 Tax=Quadrisphaera sp. DSM 44207 TaxID=1881057 RepID=UPI00088B367C|nr:substrate-binding domain-containing protein [Quadrisphaera sp. DSM 44207]SDQ83567.1 monosaccharide ABC transporter substrate-binding protein, CUT2 family [Quadrisphaera sp. DSM 44207]
MLRGRRSHEALLGSAAAALLALGATGCGTGDGGSAAAGGGGGEDVRLGVSVADQKSLFYVAAVQGMEAAAEEAGVELLVTSANNDSDAQVGQVDDLLTQQIDALIFTSQDSTAAAAGVRAANEADVPVLAVDQRPESGEGELATYIATDSVKAARDLCTWLFEQMGGEGEIAILHGVLGSTAEIQRTQGCQEAIEAAPGIRVVAEETANWDEAEAFEATQNILTANPDLKAVFGESDAMAMGAAKAAQEAGRHEGMLFVGIDGFPTMFEAVEQGLTQATMAQQPYMMGQLAVQQAIEHVRDGAELPAEQYQDTVRIDAETVGGEDVTEFYGPDAGSASS